MEGPLSLENQMNFKWILLSTHQQRGHYRSFNNPPNGNIVCVVPATAIKANCH